MLGSFMSNDEISKNLLGNRRTTTTKKKQQHKIINSKFELYNDQ